MSSGGPRVPERRVDAERFVSQINASAGTALVLVGVADHGESGGAVYAEWPDGRAAVITRTYAGLSSMQRTAQVLNELRAEGLPVPRHDALVPLADNAVGVVQERLPGVPAAEIGPEVIDRMIGASEPFSGILETRREVPTQQLHLRSSGPDFMRHETLTSYSPRSRKLLARILDIGRDRPDEVRGDDLVHPDYTFGNVLFSGGEVSGIVDWNGGIARGDRWLSLVGLRFEMSWSTIYPDGQHQVSDAAIRRLDEHLVSHLAPDVLLRYWAHWTLSRLDWTISNFPTADINLFLDLGESRLLSA